MLFKTVIVLTVVICSVNAAFTVAVFQEDQEPLSSEGDCDYRECDQLCRRLGFPGGACVGGRCKCDNFLQPQETNDIPLNDAIPLIDQNELEVPVTEKLEEQNEITLNSEANIVKDILLVDEKPEVNLRSSVLRGSCDCVSRNCNFYCFRLHYTGGICVTGQCRCYK